MRVIQLNSSQSFTPHVPLEYVNIGGANVSAMSAESKPSVDDGLTRLSAGPGARCFMGRKTQTSPSSRSRDAAAGALLRPFPYIPRLKDIPGGKALPNPRGHINKNPRAYNTIPAILAGPHMANPGTLGPNDLGPLTLN